MALRLDVSVGLAVALSPLGVAGDLAVTGAVLRYWINGCVCSASTITNGHLRDQPQFLVREPAP